VFYHVKYNINMGTSSGAYYIIITCTRTSSHNLLTR